MTKIICSLCVIKRDINYYYKDKNRPLGIRKDCKVCCAKRVKKWRERDYVKEKRKIEYTLIYIYLTKKKQHRDSNSPN